MFNLFSKCDKELELENVMIKLDHLKAQNCVLQETLDRVMREMWQLKLVVMSEKQPKRSKATGANHGKIHTL